MPTSSGKINIASSIKSLQAEKKSSSNKNSFQMPGLRFSWGGRGAINCRPAPTISWVILSKGWAGSRERWGDRAKIGFHVPRCSMATPCSGPRSKSFWSLPFPFTNQGTVQLRSPMNLHFWTQVIWAGLRPQHMENKLPGCTRTTLLPFSLSPKEL